MNMSDYRPEDFDPNTAPNANHHQNHIYAAMRECGFADSLPAEELEVQDRTFDECFDYDDEGLAALLDFTPVPCTRPDGWSPKKQRDFIKHLSTGMGVTHAARNVGMTARSAYLLRARTGSEGITAAWHTALQLGVAILEDTAFDLALTGAPHVKVNDQGMVIYRENRINPSVLMQLLRAHKPLIYSQAAQANAVRVAQEQRDHAERVANNAAWAARPDPQEEAVRMCLAEEEIKKAAAQAGVEPDLSDDYVARVAAAMPRIAPDQVTVIGMRLLEQYRAEHGYYPSEADEAAAAAEAEEMDGTDEAGDDADSPSAPAQISPNRNQRRAEERKRMKAQNRKAKNSYSSPEKRQKTA